MGNRSSEVVLVYNRILPYAGVGPIHVADLDRKVITPMGVGVCTPVGSQLEAVERNIYHRRALWGPEKVGSAGVGNSKSQDLCLVLECTTSFVGGG